MYFDKIKKFNIKEYIEKPEYIYAHIKEEILEKETLKEHLDRALKYFHKLVECKNLSRVFKNIEDKLFHNFSNDEISFFREMLLNTIYMHDLGKININFQRLTMKNKYWSNKEILDYNNSNHSCLSSIIYIDYYFKKIKCNDNLDNKKILIIFMILNGYIISKHHGDLDSLECFKEKLIGLDGEGTRLCTTQLKLFKDIYKENLIFSENENILKNIFRSVENDLKDIENEYKNISVILYIYERVVLSILLYCDYYATSEFSSGCEMKSFSEIENIYDFYDEFNNTSITKKTREYEKNKYGKIKDFSEVTDINVLRKELFLDSEKELFKNLDKNIFYLEAPTGSGKSNVAFNLTFKLIEKEKDLNKLIYVYPFNTLVEQNIKSIETIFDNKKDLLKDVAVINSIVPIKKREKEEDGTVDYQKSLLDRQFLNYPMVLTTHVSLFNCFFGILKEDIFPLVKLCNSVIVLDEIQSYKNYIWKEMMLFLKYYSEILNIKFIIMSATLPKLDKLIDGDINTANLILNRNKYFSHKLFKDRVTIDYSLLNEKVDDKEEVLKELFFHVIENGNKSDKNILIEFISKGSAVKFYKKLKEYKEEYGLGQCNKREIEIITGDDNSIERNKVIKKISEDNKKNIILVGTQVIEAGVDIDMDIGYKDISMLDCDEQFLGRINRSCLKEQGIVYFFNLDSASGIYKNDYRKPVSLTLISDKYDTRKWLKNKEFYNFYKYVLEKINEKGEDKFTEEGIDNFIKEYVNKFNFIYVNERMKLIDDDKVECSVFLNREIKLENGKTLYGEEVWNEYKETLGNNDLDYAEKKVRLSEVMGSMSYFIYKVKKDNFNNDGCIGEIYYIEDGEKYFQDGKFDREKFKGINSDIS